MVRQALTDWITLCIGRQVSWPNRYRRHRRRHRHHRLQTRAPAGRGEPVGLGWTSSSET